METTIENIMEDIRAEAVSRMYSRENIIGLTKFIFDPKKIVEFVDTIFVPSAHIRATRKEFKKFKRYNIKATVEDKVNMWGMAVGTEIARLSGYTIAYCLYNYM